MGSHFQAAAMRTFIAFCLFLGLASARHYEENLSEFEADYHIKNAGESDGERGEREERLKLVEKQINQKNDDRAAGKAKFSERLYPFSDMSKEEFEATHTGLVMPKDRNSPEILKKEAIARAKIAKMAMNRQTVPDSYDSTSEGYVTSVKNQGSCGSCVAFASVGLHEAILVKAGASISNMDLSEQYLVDCAYSKSCANGCSGASAQCYTDWFVDNGGLSPTETDYPYLGTSPLLNCDTASTLDKYDPGYKVSSMDYTYSCDEDTLKQLVYEHGSVVTAVYASDTSFSNYAEGVYDDCTSTQEDHAVLVVGYGTDTDGTDYWLVKNSWGDWWGDNGYIKIARGQSQCGIGQVCSWAAVTASDGSEDTTDASTDDTSSCDVSGLFGTTSITGTYSLTVRINRTRYYSYVTCVNSVCTPVDTSITDACVYICGSSTC